MALTDVDNEILIQEIKKRPCLYQKQHPRYVDGIYRKAMWEDVAAKVFHDTWASCDSTGRELKVRCLYTRWKNIRTCFTRELRTQLRLQRRPGSAKYRNRREYRYFDRLQFLKSHVELHRASLNTETHDEQAVSDMSETSEEENEEVPTPKVKTYTRTKPKNPKKGMATMICPTQISDELPTASIIEVNNVCTMETDFAQHAVKIEKTSELEENSVEDTSMGEITNEIEEHVVEKAAEIPVFIKENSLETTKNKSEVSNYIEINVAKTAKMAETPPPVEVKHVETEVKSKRLSPVREIVTTVNIERKSPTTQNLVEPTNNVRNSDPISQNVGSESSGINWTNFALSLVPMLNMLPVHKSIDAQIAILTALKQCLYGDGSTTSSNMAAQGGESSKKGNGAIRSIKIEHDSDDDVDLISLNQS